MPIKYGSSHVMFYDGDKKLIRDLFVQIEHPVEIMTPGPRHMASSFYTCNATGCQFASETRYELPATRHIEEQR
jgi:hypothetical protein